MRLPILNAARAIVEVHGNICNELILSVTEILAKGRKTPTVRLKRLEDGLVQDVLTDELFREGNVLVLGFPGAFTPVCEGVHLPSYLARVNDIKAKGIHSIIAVTVNDPWVTAVWERYMKCAEVIPIYADGNAEFATALGLAFEAPELGIGVRSHRYSMVVKKGVVDHLSVDNGMEVCRVTNANVVLEEM